MKMTFEDFQKQIPIQLSRQQQEAVQAVDGPVLLLAVPGSGKTTVLVTRLAFMVCCTGIRPEKILTLTYTVAATRDMEKRFRSIFGEALSNRLQFRTINSICVKIINYYGRLIGKKSFSLVTEDKSTAGILSSVYQNIEQGYASESVLKNVRTMITYIKNMMLTEEEIRQLDNQADFQISLIYKAYCSELRSRGLMDYDDQMVYAYTILRKSPETLQYFQDCYPYICVDEAQDTSRIQHAIIALLAGKTENLFMVGDEDQSIYGFRAAYPKALLNFEQAHPGAKVLLMEENFRSNAKIVVAADRFIQKNLLRHKKHMKPVRAEGASLKEIKIRSRSSQYSYLLKIADGCRKQTAVLYRDNESVLPLVDSLERRGIPYIIRNAELSFFTHRVVQDIENIIRFAFEPGDTELFLKIYYKIAVYINRQSARMICEISKKRKMNILECAVQYGGLPVNIQQNCKMINNQLRCLRSEKADTAVSRIVKEMGYGNYLERAGISDSKLFILREIARNESSARRLLERLEELQTILKEKPYDPDCKFILSTIHSSKGLEYDTVYLMDVTDGIFPENIPENLYDMNEEEREAYEEERRLFYVGVTRAKEELCVFHLSQKSTFCRELFSVSRKAKENAEPSVPDRNNAAGMLSYVPFKKKKIFSQEAFLEFCDCLGEGMIVKHKKLGRGVIVSMEKNWVNIQFEDSGQEKKLLLLTLFENDLLTWE